MAGHATKHPYLKTYDELKRSMNRMQVYLDMHRPLIPINERLAIQSIINGLEKAINNIPEEYQISRYHQFKDKE